MLEIILGLLRTFLAVQPSESYGVLGQTSKNLTFSPARGPLDFEFLPNLKVRQTVNSAPRGFNLVVSAVSIIWDHQPRTAPLEIAKRPYRPHKNHSGSQS